MVVDGDSGDGIAGNYSTNSLRQFQFDRDIRPIQSRGTQTTNKHLAKPSLTATACWQHRPQMEGQETSFQVVVKKGYSKTCRCNAYNIYRLQAHLAFQADTRY